jgi:hypothetical protein
VLYPHPLLPNLREEAAKKQASENYQKLHAAGKTDQFKKDMERLQEVKRRREKEAAERKAKDEGTSPNSLMMNV